MSVLGTPVARLEGPQKVTGHAGYAFEALPEDEVLYAWIVQSPGIGRIRSIGTGAALAMPGVVRVLTHEDAPDLADAGDGELQVLQSDRVGYRGQPVAVVIAETLETAREAAGRVRVDLEASTPDVLLSTTHPRLYTPEQVNPAFPTESREGDVDAALAAAAVTVDATYSTPAYFNNPMEPHATTAWFRTVDGQEHLHLVESTQGSSATQATLATLFGMAADRIHVRNEHVGGGFGSKGSPRPNAPLAILAARATGRTVKLAYTRQQMFALAGYRTPTISRMRLGADADGRLVAIAHEAWGQTSTVQEFAEQTAVITRHVYAAPNRYTNHRLAALDVPTPRWMRAPGEAPGSFALECAMDELAIALDTDPVELRVRNEPEDDPEEGVPFSSRNLVWCLRRGAERFGWTPRGGAPTMRREGRFLIGTGVAAAIYPAMAQASGARITARPDGTFDLGVNAADIGTGARTVLWQVAADVLGVPPERVRIRIADADLPTASVAGGSSGTASWGWAVHKACTLLRARLDGGERIPDDGLEVVTDTEQDVAARAELSRHAFGAHFAAVRVDLDSGETTVTRMCSAYAAGRILNPRTARSQFLGGMTMGIGMALTEAGEIDPVAGDYSNHDFATYHVPVGADVVDLDVDWLDEADDHLTPLGGKGIGEIGIVGSAAAIANAVRDATGVRIRDLPIRPDDLVAAMPRRVG